MTSTTIIHLTAPAVIPDQYYTLVSDQTNEGGCLWTNVGNRTTMALRCPQCDHKYYTPHARVVPDWLRDHARRNAVGHVQAESVCQTITEARAELLQYDSHIARLRATLTQLENERVRLQDFISHHETLLSPIRRVPTEVLTLIFAECCEDDDVLYTNISMTILRLGLVCHRWRSIVLTRPSFGHLSGYSSTSRPMS